MYCQIVLPIFSYLIEIYPNLILLSTILNSCGLSLPFINYLLTSHFINFDLFLEEYDDIVYCLGFSFLHTFEFFTRAVNIILSWLYFDQQYHSLYVTNVIISVFASVIGIITIILQYIKFYNGSKKRADYIKIY